MTEIPDSHNKKPLMGKLVESFRLPILFFSSERGWEKEATLCDHLVRYLLSFLSFLRIQHSMFRLKLEVSLSFYQRPNFFLLIRVNGQKSELRCSGIFYLGWYLMIQLPES